MEKTELLFDVNNEAQEHHSQGPGQRLRELRQECDISVEEIAELLKLSTTVVKKIEADNYEHFTTKLYIVGYLKTYASILKTPVDDIVARFERLNINFGEGQPITYLLKPQNPAHEKFLRRMSYLMGFVLFALVLAWWHGHHSVPVAPIDLSQSTDFTKAEEIKPAVATQRIETHTYGNDQFNNFNQADRDNDVKVTMP